MTVAQLPRDGQLCGPFQSVPEPWQEQLYTLTLELKTLTPSQGEKVTNGNLAQLQGHSLSGPPQLTKCCPGDVCLAAVYSEVLRGTLRAKSQGATVCMCQATAQWRKAHYLLSGKTSVVIHLTC